MNVFFVIAIILLLVGSAQSANLTVCPSGCAYSTIQSAIDAANAGDNIEVHSGSYNYAVLNKDVTLHAINTGEGRPFIGILVLCGHPIVPNGFDIKEVDGVKIVGNGINVCDNPGALDENIQSSALIGPEQTAEDWNDNGLALNSQGNYSGAILAFVKAIELNHEYAGAWNNLGDDLRLQGKYDKAIQALDNAIQINPQYAEAWNNKGVVLYSQGKYDDAIHDYDKAIQLNSQLAEPWNNKGVALCKQGKCDEAAQAFDKATQINPQYAGAWYDKGMALKALGRTTESDAAFVKAKELGYTG